METSISERIKVTTNKTWLSLSSIFKSKSIIVLLILFPVFSVVVPMFFIPFWGSAAYVIQVNVILTTGLLYGTIVFGYKKSTLDKNEKLLTKSRSASYLSALIVISLFVFITSGIQIILLIFLNSINMLIPDWIFASNPERGYMISNLRFLAWYWSIFWTMMITFGIFFALRKFIKDYKTHYFLVLSIVIVAFIWGGSLNDYWPGTVFVESEGTREKEFARGLFPTGLYWPTLIIFPYYAPGQLASITADFTITQYGSQWSQYMNYLNPILHLSFASDYEYAAKWNALIIAPIVWTAVLLAFGLVFKEK